jgi:hypothetical protein
MPALNREIHDASARLLRARLDLGAGSLRFWIHPDRKMA